MYNFVNYYQAFKQSFKFRIKSALKLGDDEMDVIERVLEKYRPEKVSSPKKMMFQRYPLGFTGVENVEIWFIDTVLTIPARSETLAHDLRESLGLILESPMIMVEGEFDNPMPDVTDESERQAEVEKKGALLTQPTYPEGDDTNDGAKLFSNEYNTNLLDYLNKVEKNSQIGKKVDAPNPITKWAQQPDPTADLVDTQDFNDSVGEGNKPVKHPKPGKKWSSRNND